MRYIDIFKSINTLNHFEIKLCLMWNNIKHCKKTQKTLFDPSHVFSYKCNCSILYDYCFLPSIDLISILKMTLAAPAVIEFYTVTVLIDKN